MMIHRCNNPYKEYSKSNNNLAVGISKIFRSKNHDFTEFQIYNFEVPLSLLKCKIFLLFWIDFWYELDTQGTIRRGFCYILLQTPAQLVRYKVCYRLNWISSQAKLLCARTTDPKSGTLYLLRANLKDSMVVK